MESTEFAQQTLKFHKTVFENSFSTLVMVQDHIEKMFNNYINTLPWVDEESKKNLESSADLAKKARDDFKKSIEESFVSFENLLEAKGEPEDKDGLKEK